MTAGERESGYTEEEEERRRGMLGCRGEHPGSRRVRGAVGRHGYALPANPVVTAPPSSFYIFATTRRHHRPTILSRAPYGFRQNFETVLSRGAIAEM